MRITEVIIKLDETIDTNERICAFASITLDDCLVIRDLKIIEGNKGLFVAMPSRKLLDRCECGTKNHLRANYCNYCGRWLDPDRAIRGVERVKLHADIAHPINTACRRMIEAEVLAAFSVAISERAVSAQAGAA